MKFMVKQSPGRIIALGFAVVIAVGTLLLLLPISRQPGVELSALNALFTATSATCVTGLVTVSTAETFSTFGQAVIALLIQTGGLGVAGIGVWIILAINGRVSFKNRLLLKEAWNVTSLKDVTPLLRSVLFITLFFESVGAILSSIAFARDYPWPTAVKMGVFHSISAFNNAGFDLMDGMQSLVPYQKDVFVNLVTAGLIIAGGLGFLVFMELGSGAHPRKWSLHTKAVLASSAFLIAVGAVIFRLTDRLPWLEAFFQSVSSRTAGFATVPMGALSHGGLFALTILMFIGASPGSTGGGMKTTTAFVLLQAVRSLASGTPPHAYRRSISQSIVLRASLILLVSLTTVCLGTVALCILEPEQSLISCLVEVTSAFATVGLSTGITPELGAPGKLLVTAIMYFGRIGLLTMVSLSASQVEPRVKYSEEHIMVG